MSGPRHIREWLGRIWLAAAFAGSLVAVGSARGESIVYSKHNLSVTGPGPARALSEERICVFCHTPHGATGAAPLWNRRESFAAYMPYDSPTLQAQPGQPTGASKLCLSCHDGTIALGDLLSEDMVISMSSGGVMPPGQGLIGTDLRDDHPISFDYFESMGQAGGELASPGMWDPRVKLDAASELQCTTCHDPHDNQWGDFLVMDNMYSLLCQQCHIQPLFSQTSHAFSGRQWSGAGRDPWPHTEYPDVGANACLNCHLPHHAEGFEGLLTFTREEEVCLVCHDGNVATYNMRAVFNKASTHRLDATEGVHEAGEDPSQAGDHVECVDCHNPHRARLQPSEPPFVKGVLEGVTGIDAGGSPVLEAAFEYEICFKCHADSGAASFQVIVRQIPSINTRNEFSTASPSYHPIEAPGMNPDVPSLLAPWTPASMMYCTDCHNNDAAQVGVVGSAGPHGSNFEPILARQYITGDFVSESPTAYALCYQCHNRSSILSDQSFPNHRKHIVEERTPCSVCHDPHGIDIGEGNAMNNAHLINFDVSVVDPDPVSGRLEYRTLGLRSGECYLSCHGEVHSPEQYP